MRSVRELSQTEELLETNAMKNIILNYFNVQMQS